MQNDKKIVNSTEIRYLLMGSAQITEEQESQIPWLSKKQYNLIKQLQELLPAFKGILSHLNSNQAQWKTLYESQDKSALQDPAWPHEWTHYNGLNLFQRLIFIKIIRPDKVVRGLQELIQEYLSPKFVDFTPPNINTIYEQSTCQQPIIFIFSTGSDPRKDIENLAMRQQMGQRLILKSMGQGQGEAAAQAIKQGLQEGKWILIQNCHLGISFMPQLLQIYENFPKKINQDFRLFFTLIPFEQFPIPILQKSMKITYENPQGVKRSLQGSFNSFDYHQISRSKNVLLNQKLFYNLCFFHAIIQERIKFGSIGWNVPYEFNMSDLFISMEQVINFVDSYEEIQWDALNYLIAEANYGGKVTDQNDRVLLHAILKKYFGPQILSENYQFTDNNLYPKPREGDFNFYLQQINLLPVVDSPSIFGLHSNSEIYISIKEGEQTCLSLFLLMPKQYNEAEDEQLNLKNQCITILDQLPQLFDVEMVQEKHPVTYEQSMNVVLQQEVLRYNKLLQRVRIYMQNCIQTFEGTISLTTDLEQVKVLFQILNNIVRNTVPQSWSDFAYPSLKPLLSWILDLINRLNFLDKWIQEGPPIIFWISGFFFTQSFFTGVLQNFSRKYDISVDTLIFDFAPIEKNNTIHDLNEHPSNGCFINGLFLEGSRWDFEKNIIDDQLNNQLYCEMCTIFCEAIKMEDQVLNTDKYSCPVYRTALRQGDSTSTGHSTNYILNIPLPISKQHTPEFWIRRGAAMITQLSE